MEHLLLKAATSAATDQGTFEAVISTASVDRDKDIIEPSAVVASLAKWAALDKLAPLAWVHTDEIVGHIEPASARAEGDEVVAKGFVDREAERGPETWRLVKSGTLSFSFGFLFDPKTDAEKLPNGRYRIKRLDVFEISVVPVGPANNDTRVLNFKAMNPGQMAARMRAMADEMAGENPPDPQDMARRMRAMAEDMAAMSKSASPAEPADEETADVTGKEPKKARSVDPLRKQAESIALEFASDGLSLQTPPRKVPQPKREPELGLRELKQRMRDELLMHLSGEPL